MTKMRDLAYGQPLPEMVTDSLMELLGSYVSPNFQVAQLSNTQVRVAAGSDNDQVTVSINGRWRYNTANADATHPGGAVATYDVYVTGSDNSFSGAPEVDATVYSFGVQIRAAASPPATALYRKVATLDWDGSKITRVAPLVGVGVGGGSGVTATDFVAVAPATALRNTVKPTADVVPLTVSAAVGQTANRVEVRDGANALVARVASDGKVEGTSLAVTGSAGTLAIRSTTNTTDYVVNVAKTGDTTNRLRVRADGMVSWGPGGVTATDVDLYRTAAATLRTDGGVQVGVDVTLTGSASKVSLMAAANAAVVLAQGGVTGDSQPRVALLASGMLQLGAGGASAADVNLYRAGANVLATDDQFALSPTGTPTTSAFGVKFGNDSAAVLYRAGSGLLKTDAVLSVAGAGVEANRIVPASGTALTLYAGTSGPDGSGVQQGTSGYMHLRGKVFVHGAADAVAAPGYFPEGSLFARGGVFAPGATGFLGSDSVLPTNTATKQFGVVAPYTGYYMAVVTARVDLSAGVSGVTNIRSTAKDAFGAQLLDVAGSTIHANELVPASTGDQTISIVVFVHLDAGQAFDWWMSRSGASGTVTLQSVASGVTLALLGTDGLST